MFLANAISNAIRYIIAICTIYAFVEATDISGPACVYTTISASLAIDEPLTLTIAIVSAPLCFASSKAAFVSAVSPDCDITIIRSPSPISGSLYLNSDAISTTTGTLTSFSITYFPTIPACIAVPQATMYIFL